eukprot:5296212-Amphidinium_carterae.1
MKDCSTQTMIPQIKLRAPLEMPRVHSTGARIRPTNVDHTRQHKSSTIIRIQMLDPDNRVRETLSVAKISGALQTYSYQLMVNYRLKELMIFS